MRKIALKDATDDQLRTYARTVAGLDVHHNAGRDSIIGKLVQAGYAEIEASDEEAASPLQEPAPTAEPPQNVPGAIPPAEVKRTDAATKRALRDNSSAKDRIVKLTVHKGQGKSGARPLPVAVNGVAILIPRGEITYVPERYYEVLNNAVRSDYTQDDETGDILETQSYAYGFQFHGYLDRSDPEYVAWLEKQKAKRQIASAQVA